MAEHVQRRTRRFKLVAAAGAASLIGAAWLGACAADDSAAKAVPCDPDNGGLTLSPGYCATVFADNLGHVRHLVVGPNGVVYANTWSGGYYPNAPPPEGGFLVALRDADQDGHAEVIERFGEGVAQGASGGTGVAVYGNALYAEVSDRIVRYALAAGQVAPRGQPEVIVSGLPLGGDHPMHPFAIDAKGGLFVNLGSASNACQAQNRAPGVPGADPCTELATRGGIWRYDAGRPGQRFSPEARYATGIRNTGGIAFDAGGRMFATQHGRDQLAENWPALYKPGEGAELPAEELLQVGPGDNFGWPQCYYDGTQGKLVLAPEYGGDGGKAVGVCAQRKAPVAAFPAHWAPNDVAIYSGAQFPAAWRGGAFIAFHGSWNRAPFPQGGYNVVFQPLKDGKASGDWVVFADGFAGGEKDPGKAAFRPAGLAVGPDGALYIADDVKGRIWRVAHAGAAGAGAIAPAPAPKAAATAAAGPDLPVPPGGTAEQVALGEKIYHGASGGTCAGCHGVDGAGTPLGPALTGGTWLWGDGGLASITGIVAKGVPTPKKYRAPMPPAGGAQLSPQEVAAVSAYVWAIGHAGKR